jgi:hypothetical protein
MRNHLLVSTLLLTVQAAFGQLDDNTLSVTSSRVLSTRTDDFQILVTAETPGDFTLDAAIRALEGTGVTTSHLIAVNTQPASRNTNLSGPAITAWTFRLRLPFSKLNEALTSLGRFRAPTGVTMYYSVESGPAVPAPCPWQTLFGDAQIQAQKLASAAGFKAGPILGLSDKKELPQLLIPVVRIGSFSQFAPIGTIFDPVGTISFGELFVGGQQPETCSLTVQFRLLR